MGILDKLKRLFQSWYPPSLDSSLGDPELAQALSPIKQIGSSYTAMLQNTGPSYANQFDTLEHFIQSLRQGK